MNSTSQMITASSAPLIVEDILSAVARTVGPAGKGVALHEPEFLGRERAYVTDCIDSGWVSSVGSYVDRFERDLERFTGAAHAIATSNGTSALHVCLLLAGVERGDEVLMPALTFIATANAVAYLGATPHFVDSESASLGVDADALDRHLHRIAEVSDGACRNRSTGARIRALVVMHVFGHSADLDALQDLARRWHLTLVEDAAESLGSYYKHRHTGTSAVLAALSFNGNKVITTGGGGAILTSDPTLAKRAKHLTTTARVPHRWSFIHDEVGFNYRLPNLNAALGCAQLERLGDMLTRKRRLAEAYAHAFGPVNDVRFLREPKDTRSNYWLNAIVLEHGHEGARDEVLQALNDAGYMARPIWTLMHRLPMYSACPRADLRVAERLEQAVINVPSSPRLVNERNEAAK